MEKQKGNKLRWLRLDNAAKIYPAARRNNWTNVFRLSMTLTEEVDQKVLKSALDVTVKRFPSIAARLRRGLFWYYLQQVPEAPQLRREGAYPITYMQKEELRSCALRVIPYKNRIAVEFFHSLTDGNGGLVFIKSLVAEYLEQKYGVEIPCGDGILDRREDPKEEELEDSFQRYAGPVQASRKATDAFHLSGTPEPDGYLNLTCLKLSARQVLEKAHEQGVSVTAYLAAAMMQTILRLQKDTAPRTKKMAKVLIPVNLRRLFPSQTLRNFAMYTTPEADPRLAPYSFQELCKLVHHHMGLEVNTKRMGSMIATNISSERSMAVRLIPLFLKNIVMKIIFDLTGERKSCLSMSNLGVVQLPEQMEKYVSRIDFILGVQAMSPYNCGVVSYGDDLYINFIRGVKETGLEYRFFKVLQEQGLQVQAQSNH